MQIELFPVSRRDIRALAAIQKKAFVRLYKRYRDRRNPYRKGGRELRGWLGRQDVVFLKILSGGGLCGGLAWFIRPRGEYYLARVFVLPSLQGQGIARQAILLAQRQFPDALRFTLDFPADQERNRRCYEACGYTDTGVRKQLSESLTLALYEKRAEADAGSLREQRPGK